MSLGFLPPSKPKSLPWAGLGWAGLNSQQVSLANEVKVFASCPLMCSLWLF